MAGKSEVGVAEDGRIRRHRTRNLTGHRHLTRRCRMTRPVDGRAEPDPAGSGASRSGCAVSSSAGGTTHLGPSPSFARPTPAELEATPHRTSRQFVGPPLPGVPARDPPDLSKRPCPRPLQGTLLLPLALGMPQAVSPGNMVGRNQAIAGFQRIDFGRAPPHFGPCFARFRPTLTNFDCIRATFGRTQAEIGPLRLTFG